MFFQKCVKNAFSHTFASFFSSAEQLHHYCLLLHTLLVVSLLLCFRCRYLYVIRYSCLSFTAFLFRAIRPDLTSWVAETSVSFYVSQLEHKNLCL